MKNIDLNKTNEVLSLDKIVGGKRIKTQSSTGGTDSDVQKVDKNGKVIWTKHIY